MSMASNQLQGVALTCPIHGYTTTAETQEGHVARFIEHLLDAHDPDGMPTPVQEKWDFVAGTIKTNVTGRFH